MTGILTVINAYWPLHYSAAVTGLAVLIRIYGSNVKAITDAEARD